MPLPPPPSKGCACRDLTNGFRPPKGIMMPAVVNRPHLTRSRRETLPCDKALVISARSRRAFSASRIRLLSEYSFNQKVSSLSFRPMLFLLVKSSACSNLEHRERCWQGLKLHSRIG